MGIEIGRLDGPTRKQEVGFLIWRKMPPPYQPWGLGIIVDFGVLKPREYVW